MTPPEARAYHDLLAGSAAFSGLDDDALKDIAGRGLLLGAGSGDLVMFEKTRGGPGLYVVLEGQVEVFLAHEAQDLPARREPVHLNTLGPGDCFGEYSLIDSKDTSASARALCDTKLFFLPRGEFIRITEGDAQAGRAIYRNLLLFLIRRLRQKDEHLDVLILR